MPRSVHAKPVQASGARYSERAPSPSVSSMHILLERAMNVIEALREVGVKRRLLIYGVNGSPYAKEAIKKGYMAGTAAQSPISMGQIGVETAYQLMDGKKPDKHISVPVIFITAKNVDDFFQDGWQ